MQVYDIPVNKYGRETTQHGTPDFPLAVYNSVLGRNVLGCTPWHWHEELQFCVVTSGEVRFSIPGQEFAVKAGSGLFLNSGVLHAAEPVNDPESSYICVDIGVSLLKLFPGSVFERRYTEPYLHSQFLTAEILDREILWQRKILDDVLMINEHYAGRGFGWEGRCLCCLWEAWLNLLEHTRCQEGKAVSRHMRTNSAVQKMLQYMAEHYEEPISIAEIAGYAAFSSSECCRLFKRVTGKTVFEYLCSYRLGKSVSLLLETDAAVAEIAYAAGFCSSSYYIKVFRETFGVTPLQYRKKRRTQV